MDSIVKYSLKENFEEKYVFVGNSQPKEMNDHQSTHNQPTQPKRSPRQQFSKLIGLNVFMIYANNCIVVIGLVW